jgi:RNA polymerase sigma-70 factor (ECF subfamily)
MNQDAADIRSVLKGDRAAFKRLVERYQGYVYTISLRVLKDREDAEEAAQDTFVKVYRSLPDYRQESKFSTWLYSVAYRTAVDHARRKRLPTSSLDKEGGAWEIADNQAGPLRNAERNNLQEVLRKVLNKLPGVEGNIITLYYQGGKSVKEIAEILALSESNVKVKLHRTRGVLKKQLSHYLQAEIQDLL